MAEYRITFAIERAEDGDAEFTEVGFGSSSSWSSIDAAVHDLASIIQCREWETTDGMPDPDDVDPERAR